MISAHQFTIFDGFRSRGGGDHSRKFKHLLGKLDTDGTNTPAPPTIRMDLPSALTGLLDSIPNPSSIPSHAVRLVRGTKEIKMRRN
jgi:hypothetical protein